MSLGTLSGMKILGYEENEMYSETHGEYFEDLDCLQDYIEDNDEHEINEDFKIEVKKVFVVQFWFPTVNYIKKYLDENKRFPTIDVLIDEIIERTSYDFSEFDINIKPEDIREFKKFEFACLNYLKYQNDELLKTDLAQFQQENEHFHFTYVDIKSESKFHVFKFIENGNDEVELKYLGELKNVK